MFLSIYWCLALPTGSVGVMYLMMLCIVWWSSGLAYAVATMLPPDNSMMAGTHVRVLFLFLHWARRLSELRIDPLPSKVCACSWLGGG